METVATRLASTHTMDPHGARRPQPTPRARRDTTYIGAICPCGTISAEIQTAMVRILTSHGVWKPLRQWLTRTHTMEPHDARRPQPILRACRATTPHPFTTQDGCHIARGWLRWLVPGSSPSTIDTPTTAAPHQLGQAGHHNTLPTGLPHFRHHACRLPPPLPAATGFLAGTFTTQDGCHWTRG